MTLPKKVWVNVLKIILENTGIDRADRGCRKNGRAATFSGSINTKHWESMWNEKLKRHVPSPCQYPRSTVLEIPPVRSAASDQWFRGWGPLVALMLRCTTNVQILEILLSKKLGRGGFSLPLEGD